MERKSMNSDGLRKTAISVWGSGKRPEDPGISSITLPWATRFIDYGTLVLLFSMMLIVANLHLVDFFDVVAEVAIERLGARHLLPAVSFTSGVLSAFFVNDIICLVMVPFVLHMTRRMGLPPLAYLLAVATGSNIGSVASITGNPQNMLIGSVSGIRYPVFLAHLG